jgi:hemerythrin
LKIADRAYDLLKNNLYTDKYDKIVEILEELKNYTICHFQSEEAYMMRLGYKKILKDTHP